MNKIAISAVIKELDEIQSGLPSEASDQARQLIEERIAQYRDKKRQAPSSNVSNADHARADILSDLEKQITEEKGSPLSKRGLDETITTLATSLREAANDDTPGINFEVFRGLIHELTYLRQMASDISDTVMLDALNDRIQCHVQRRSTYRDHPPHDIANAQAEVLARFNEYIRHTMRPPLRKNAITSELLKWSTFARQGMPLPDQRHPPQDAAS